MIYNITIKCRKKVNNMAATTTTTKIEVKIKLNNGTSVSGGIRTISVNLGKISLSGYDTDKVYNIVQALGPCFSKTIFNVEKLEYASVRNI